MQSCGLVKNSTKQTTEVVRVDSIVFIETVKIDTFRVPADTITLTVPVTVLQRDTVIRFRTDRLKANLTVVNDHLNVECITDSLEHLIISKNKEIARYKANSFTQLTEVKKTKERPLFNWLAKLLLLALVSAVIYITITYFKHLNND